MSSDDITPIDLQRAIENLRQERETFEQQKKQDDNWFKLKLAIGGSSIILFFIITLSSLYIIFNFSNFPVYVVTAASVAFGADVLGILASVWKIVLNPNFSTKLGPITKVDDSVIERLRGSLK